MGKIADKFDFSFVREVLQQRYRDLVDHGCGGSHALRREELLEKAPHARVLRWIRGRAGSQRQPAARLVNIDDLLRDAVIRQGHGADATEVLIWRPNHLPSQWVAG